MLALISRLPNKFCGCLSVCLSVFLYELSAFVCLYLRMIEHEFVLALVIQSFLKICELKLKDITLSLSEIMF